MCVPGDLAATLSVQNICKLTSYASDLTYWVLGSIPQPSAHKSDVASIVVGVNNGANSAKVCDPIYNTQTAHEHRACDKAKCAHALASALGTVHNVWDEWNVEKRHGRHGGGCSKRKRERESNAEVVPV